MFICTQSHQPGIFDTHQYGYARRICLRMCTLLCSAKFLLSGIRAPAMQIKKVIRNFFGFSRVEVNGFLVLIPLIIALLFSEPLYRRWRAHQPKNFNEEIKQLDSLLALSSKVVSVNDTASVQSTYFRFNPNTASKDELIELGFTESLAARMTNYRSKGGTFWVKNDLKKIYGMDTLLVKKLWPFIELPEVRPTTEKPAYTKQLTQIPTALVFDINQADTAQLKSIYGIGDKLSQRIVSYRESLGGFVHLQQLNEVFGLDSTVVKRLRARVFIEPQFVPRKINLNTATQEMLEKHPYLNKREAKAIMAYRFQHGKFSSVAELEKLLLLEEETTLRVQPYVTIE
jgi:competence protein ComEA